MPYGVLKKNWVVNIKPVSNGRQFADNHKVKLGKNRSKTNGVKLSKMASGLWVSLRYFIAGRESSDSGNNKRPIKAMWIIF